MTRHSLGGDAADALKESLILGLLAGAEVAVDVGDIAPDGVLPAKAELGARRSVSIAEAETGGEVASGEGTEGAEEPENDCMVRNGGIPGGGGINKLDVDAVAAADVEETTPGTDEGAGDPEGGGERAGEAGIAAGLPPGVLNSA